ncbi:MAG: hypothetical protein Kow00124_25010 [Anaerolineae bacterium]
MKALVAEAKVEMMTGRTERRHIPLLLWPFWAVWRLLALLVELTGRLVAVLLGLALMIAGVVLSITVVGAVVGIPLAVLGLLLMIAGLF